MDKDLNIRIRILKDAIDDIDEWSVEHGDDLNEEVSELNGVVESIEGKYNG